MPSRSKSQQRLFGMVHAYQKGKLDDAPEHIKAIARSISEEDAEHFAKTKHKGLPEKKAFITTINRRNTMNKAYERGFMDKCAEMGVDPTALKKITRKDILHAILDYEGVKSDDDARKYEFDGVKTVKDLKKLIKHKVSHNGPYEAEAIMGDPKSWAMQYFLARRKDGKPVVALAGD